MEDEVAAVAVAFIEVDPAVADMIPIEVEEVATVAGEVAAPAMVAPMVTVVDHMAEAVTMDPTIGVDLLWVIETAAAGNQRHTANHPTCTHYFERFNVALRSCFCTAFVEVV